MQKYQAPQLKVYGTVMQLTRSYPVGQCPGASNLFRQEEDFEPDGDHNHYGHHGHNKYHNRHGRH